MSNFTISNSTMSSNSACRLFNNMICVLRSENTISLNIKVSSISYHLLLCLKEVVVWYWYNYCRNVIAIDHTELISIFIFNSWQISQCEPNHYLSCIMFRKDISMIQSMHKEFLNFLNETLLNFARNQWLRKCATESIILFVLKCVLIRTLSFVTYRNS